MLPLRLTMLPLRLSIGREFFVTTVTPSKPEQDQPLGRDDRCDDRCDGTATVTPTVTVCVTANALIFNGCDGRDGRDEKIRTRWLAPLGRRRGVVKSSNGPRR
jgi:hypothetical protein